jgi:hypothetical protein
MTIWRMIIACCTSISKSANAYSEYVIFIAFPVQRLLEHASVLPDTYIAYRVKVLFYRID